MIAHSWAPLPLFPDLQSRSLMVRCEVIDNQGKLRGTPSDEEDTLGDLKTFRQTLFDPTVTPSYDDQSRLPMARMM